MIVDTREKGTLPKKLVDACKAELQPLTAGDYIIHKPKGLIVIERTRIDDFIGKIISGRIHEQMSKCKQFIQANDPDNSQVILLLEGITDQSFSHIPDQSKLAEIAVLSQEGIQIICTRNVTESWYFIHKLWVMYEVDQGKWEHAIRVPKYKAKTDAEQAVRMVMSIPGIGQKTAQKMLSHRSIAEVVQNPQSTPESRLKAVVEAKT